MNDVEFLVLLLACFYVWECLYWIRRPGIAFRSWFGAGWNLKLPTGGLSNRFGGFLLSMPLPSFGGLFAVNWPGLIITETKLIKHPDPLDLYDEVPTKSEGSIDLDLIERIQAKRHHVLINGKKFVAAGSPALAESLVLRIKKLRAEKPDARLTLESQFLKESFDTKIIREHVDTLRKSTRLLGFLSILLLAHVGIVMPWIGLNYSLSDSWPVLVGFLVSVNTAITIQFYRLHRRLYPTASDERFQHTLMMSLYPLASIRATETLSRPRLENFHPLAVAKELLTASQFERFAAQHVCRLKVRVETTASPDERNSVERLKSATWEFLRHNKIDVDELFHPPKAGDPSCRSYCPRCGSQFTFEEGKCSDCGSVPVLRLKVG